MANWPFPHDWGSVYTVTLSYKTNVLTSRDGSEQRRAMRFEPRRTIETSVVGDARDMRAFDRFIWTVKQQTFTHIDPVDGAVRSVRLPSSQDVTHKTSGVSEVDAVLSVDPGSETFDTPEPDAAFSYGQRYIFPLPVNWRDGVDDTYSYSAEVVDFDRSRIAVFLPVAFSTRVSQTTVLIEDDSLEKLFRAMRGQQGEFWTISATDDLLVIGTLGSDLVIEGDITGQVNADTVHRAIWLEFPSGQRIIRRVTGVALSAGNTLVALDADYLAEDALPRRATWAFLTRFASDDLVIQWSTPTVGESQPQMLTLPADLAPDAPIYDDDTAAWVDYVGYGFDALFVDPLDYIVNIQMARVGGDVTTRDWYEDGLDYIVNVQIPEIG